MIRAQSQVVIKRSVEDVFTYVSDGFFQNYPKWSPEVVKLERLSPGSVGLGTAARQVRIDGGRRTISTFQVNEYEELKKISFVSTSRPHFSAHYGVEPMRDSTRLTFTFELKPESLIRPFERLVAGAVRAGSYRVVNKLKRLLENEPRTKALTSTSRSQQHHVGTAP